MAEREEYVPRMWVLCPEGCGVRLPHWAGRAKWEHMDTAHRDSDPETPWAAHTEDHRA